MKFEAHPDPILKELRELNRMMFPLVEYKGNRYLFRPAGISSSRARPGLGTPSYFNGCRYIYPKGKAI